MLTEIKVNDRVKYGIRYGYVMRLGRYWNQDCALVQAERLLFGDGYLPHWVPLADLKKCDQTA